VRTLTDRDVRILKAYYLQSQTLAVIAKREHLTRERIRLIILETTSMLRQFPRLRRRFIRRELLTALIQGIIREATTREFMHHTRCPFSDEIDET